MAQKPELERVLNEACKYLKLDLGLEKPNSEIRFYSKQEWGELEKQGVSGIAFYDPKEEKACMGPESSIPDLIHEYFGHALYSEQSSLGKKFKQAIQKDTKLTEETKQFFEKIKPLQEGFSTWMEEKILKQLGLTDLWKDRYELITRSPYASFYNSFLKEESEKGTITLLYKLGFPKSKNPEIIKKVAKENLKNFDSLEYLIQYGSLERDIDLVAVYPDDILQKKGMVYNGCIDANVLNKTLFLQQLKLYDIEILEPVLTGNLLIGNEKDFKKIKSDIKKGEPSKEAVDHANKRSLETFNSAMFFYNQSRFKHNNLLLNSDYLEAARTILGKERSNSCTEDLLYVLNNLSFSMSYKLSAEHYNKNNFTTFKNLTKNPILKNIIQYLKNVENGRESLREDKTLGLLNSTKSFLLEQFHP